MSQIKEQPLVAKVEKIAPIRKAIAINLKEVMNSVAYCSLDMKAKMKKLWDHRAAVNKVALEKHNLKLTFLPWIIKAASIALSEFPVFTAKFDETTGEVSYPSTIDISIAVDTPYGLVVPVIRGIENLSLVQIQQEITRLSGLARDRKLSMKDMMGGCFTVTNVGSVGVISGSPIMNKGQLSIIATGRIEDTVIVEEGNIVPSKIMNISIAADHRWVDGADMGRFTGRIIELLENPESLGEI